LSPISLVSSKRLGTLFPVSQIKICFHRFQKSHRNLHGYGWGGMFLPPPIPNLLCFSFGNVCLIPLVTEKFVTVLDPVQNHALRLCLGAFRTSPASSLCVEANEPPLQLRRKKLSLQYTLKFSANQSNPAHKTVFNSNFKTSFDRKPNQIPSLGFCTSSDL